MKENYSYPECQIFGPTAPRTVLFILAWEASFGGPGDQCEGMIEAYPLEVDHVLAEWSDVPGVCGTLRSMRARIILRKLAEEITATENPFTNTK